MRVPLPERAALPPDNSLHVPFRKLPTGIKHPAGLGAAKGRDVIPRYMEISLRLSAVLRVSSNGKIPPQPARCPKLSEACTGMHKEPSSLPAPPVHKFAQIGFEPRSPIQAPHYRTLHKNAQKSRVPYHSFPCTNLHKLGSFRKNHPRRPICVHARPFAAPDPRHPC